MPPLARRVRTSSGSSIYLEEAGRGQAVLAIHGLGGGAYFFRGVAQRLAPRYRFLSVDLPGTGRSTSGIRPFTMESWIDDLGELVIETGAPVVILGHSLGTILALKAWAAWPERVRALIFVGGIPEVRPAIRERLGPRRMAVTETGSMAGWGAKVSPGIFSTDALGASPEVVGLFESLFETQNPAAYVRSLELLLATTAAPIAPLVTCPALAVVGSEDQYAPPEAVDAFMRAVPGSRGTVTLPDCAHMPFFEAPARFAAAVDSFMNSL